MSGPMDLLEKFAVNREYTFARRFFIAATIFARTVPHMEDPTSAAVLAIKWADVFEQKWAGPKEGPKP